jgi:protein-disulfide isomerase
MTRIQSRMPRAVLALLPLVTACSGASGTAARASESAPGADRVVAEWGDVRITEKELDEKAGQRLASLRQQEYEIRRQVLEELARERLVEKEAKARGISPSELARLEVDEKVPAPTSAEIQEVYERNKARLAGRTLEQVRPDIERALKDRARAQRAEAWKRELFANSGLKILLDPPRAEVSIPPGTPALGPESAPVTLIEFADYECPYCQRAQSTVEMLLQKNPGKVRLVHRDYPIEGHPRAFPASRAARCADEQGKFWEYHRRLLEPGADLSDQGLRAHATTLGLREDKFGSCLTSDRHDRAIHDSVAEGSALGVSATPTFFVNGRMVVGARPFEDFQQIIDEELARGR